MHIRKMTADDIPQAEYICIKTADEKLINSESKREITLLLYNKYYTRCEPENCFVLADNSDLAVGYILCAENYKRYKKSFYKNELKQLFKIKPSAVIEGISCVMGNRIFSKNYPAHMHIDILPEYQSKGYGTMLLTALTEQLKKKHISGLMLIVDSSNTNAVKFYRKNNFKNIKKLAGAIVMGVKL